MTLSSSKFTGYTTPASFYTDHLNYTTEGYKAKKRYFVTGYITSDDIDSMQEIVPDVEFDNILQQLKTRSVKLDLEHSHFLKEFQDETGEIPYGKIIEAKIERHDGKLKIWVKAELNSNHKRFNEIWGSIQDGYLDGFSIAYRAERHRTVANGQEAHILKNIWIKNVALTGVPVNTDAGMMQSFYKSLRGQSKMNIESDVLDGLKSQIEQLQYQVRSLQNGLKGMDSMEMSVEDDDEEDEDASKEDGQKAKYIKREGQSGNYKYTYADDEQGKGSSKQEMSDDEHKKNISAIKTITSGSAERNRSMEDMSTERLNSILDTAIANVGSTNKFIAKQAKEARTRILSELNSRDQSKKKNPPGATSKDWDAEAQIMYGHDYDDLTSDEQKRVDKEVNKNIRSGYYEKRAEESLKFYGEKFPHKDSEGNSYRKTDSGARIYDPNQKEPIKKKKSSTFEEVLADPEGKDLVEGIEDTLSSLDSKPKDKELQRIAKSQIKELKDKFGYEYEHDGFKSLSSNDEAAGAEPDKTGGDTMTQPKEENKVETTPAATQETNQVPAAVGVDGLKSLGEKLDIVAKAIDGLKSEIGAIKTKQEEHDKVLSQDGFKAMATPAPQPREQNDAAVSPLSLVR